MRWKELLTRHKNTESNEQLIRSREGSTNLCGCCFGLILLN